MSWLSATRARLRLLSGRAVESRMDQEFDFHIEMEVERLMREEGLDAAEARRRALVAFGGVEKHKEALREGRGVAWLSGLSLDLKLGGRMLVKYPGLTIVGGFAMAFAIWVGAVFFEMVMLFVSPTLPLPEADRIVHLRNYDVQASDPAPRALYDFVVWRQAMRTVTDFGAWQDLSRNLIGRDGEARPVQIASMSAAGFRVAGIRPALGRVLVPGDEQPGSPAVIVLGHDVWQTRFAGDSAIVGKTVQLGADYATVVGVMPEGFAFPVSHEAWIPFRPKVAEEVPGAGPPIGMFARLAPGASLEEAQAELTALGQRAARELPDTHQHLQPQIMPYAQMFGSGFTGDAFPIFLLIQLFPVMLLVLVCGNVALLMFARAATREGEIIVRSALGASRRRIVLQLFAEALVLGGVAAAFGLFAAYVALDQWASKFLESNLDQIPFWLNPRLSPATVLYALGLTLLAAAIAGGLPGLKVTRGIGARLRAGTSGGGGLRFGGVWTAVIVAQVAVTVAIPSLLMLELRELHRVQSDDVGFAADEYLAVRLDTEADPEAQAGDAAGDAERARFANRVELLRQRLTAEPGVIGATFVDHLPRTNYGYSYTFVDDSASIAAAAAATGQSPRRYTKTSLIDPSYFEVLGAPILAGRSFQPADLARGSRVAIVDQGFVDQVLLGRNPIGRRVRIAGDPVPTTAAGVDSLPWYEIVGVVPDLGMIGRAESSRGLGIYRPATAGIDFAPNLLIHTRGDPMALVPRLRAIAATVDPTMRLAQIQRMDQVEDSLVWVLKLWIRITLGVTAVALLLSLAGIYAVLSFTVARRTREIGVRVALGADRRRILTGIFRRPMTQVGLGILAGAILIALGAEAASRTTQFRDAPGAGLSLGEGAALVAYAVFMAGVCLLACIGPTRRALGVEPIAAMRVD